MRGRRPRRLSTLESLTCPAAFLLLAAILMLFLEWLVWNSRSAPMLGKSGLPVAGWIGMPGFSLAAPYQPAGDQPKAIEALVRAIREGRAHQTLIGVRWSGETFTLASIIARVGRPTLVIAANKTRRPTACRLPAALHFNDRLLDFMR